MTILFQGMFIVTHAFQMLSRRPRPAHPLLPLAARHVVNPFLQVRPLSCDRPSASIASDSPPLSVTPNPLFVPPHLLPYILPPFRRLYLNGPAPNPVSTDDDESVPSSAPEGVEKINARLQMENGVLRQSCHAWRARANAHVAAHLGLSALLRLARDQTRTLKDERDELSQKYDALKRKFSDVVR